MIGAVTLLPALIAGYEVGGLLESAYGPKTTPAGLRASPLYGTLAAAAASQSPCTPSTLMPASSTMSQSVLSAGAGSAPALPAT